MSSHLYYRDAETKGVPGTFFPHWNWAAFLFGPVWLAYRRCYLYALLLFIGVHFFDILLLKSGLSRVQSILAFLPIRIAMGYFGTSLYLRVWRTSQQSHNQHTSIFAIFIYALFDFIISSFDYNRPAVEQWDHLRDRYYFHFDVIPPHETPLPEDHLPQNDLQAEKTTFDDLQDV